MYLLSTTEAIQLGKPVPYMRTCELELIILKSNKSLACMKWITVIFAGSNTDLASVTEDMFIGRIIFIKIPRLEF